MRIAAARILVTASLSLAIFSLGLVSCAGGGADDGSAGAEECSPECLSVCEGQCATSGDSVSYDECMEACSCGCD
jgi:hypothetical protein